MHNALTDFCQENPHVIPITIYCLSVFMAWLYLHCLYGENGKWRGDKPDEFAFLAMFVPLINTLFSILAWCICYPMKPKPGYKNRSFMERLLFINKKLKP